MSIVEKIEQDIESGVKAVEKFFTGEGEAAKSDVEGAVVEVEGEGQKLAEDAAGAVEGEAGNVAKAVETPSTQVAATGVAAEAEPASQTGLTGTSPAA